MKICCCPSLDWGGERKIKVFTLLLSLAHFLFHASSALSLILLLIGRIIYCWQSQQNPLEIKLQTLAVNKPRKQMCTSSKCVCILTAAKLWSAVCSKYIQILLASMMAYYIRCQHSVYKTFTASHSIEVSTSMAILVLLQATGKFQSKRQTPLPPILVLLFFVRLLCKH